MSSHDFLKFAVIYLGFAVIAVLVFHRLGLGSVLGYLVAGIVIGPSALGLISSPEQVLQFSEFGVVLFLFLIGLELNPRRLWALRKPIFGMGGMQVSVGIVAMTGVGLLFRLEPAVALVLGLGFALSSTAIALQLLRERNLHQIPVGEASFAVLLFQDLAVIPMLALLPFLGTAGKNHASITIAERLLPIGKGALALVIVVLLGRYLVRPIFRAIARTQVRELFTAFALALIFGVAMLMENVGLSMALGAFLAGVLLAESEFRHELEVDLEPFKGLLLGLFFIAVGMSTPLSLLTEQPFTVVGLTLSLLGVKLALLYGVGRFFGHSRDESKLFAIALSQGGEFAFVLFGLAGQLDVIASETRDLFNICIALSMATTPFLFMLLDVWKRRHEGDRRARKAAGLGPEHVVSSGENPVILAGFGRVGQVAARVLSGQSIGITILEQDPGQIESMKRFGWVTYYGDVSRLDLLRAAGAATAKLLILAIDDMEAIERTIEIVRENFPHLKMLVRADSRIDAYHFINLEVPVVRSTFAPGLEMGEEALKLLGYSPYESHVIGQRFKRYDRIELQRQAKHVGDLDTMIALSAQSREELLRIMATDREKRAEIADEGWG